MEPDEKRARVATEPDVVLVCSGEKLVHTHRHKLVEVSPVFAAMLNGEWVESEAGKVRVAFESDVVKTFIEQISPFPPELRVNQWWDNKFRKYEIEIENLCEVAHYYDVQPLACKLQKLLLEIKRTPETVKPLFELAVNCDYHDLKSKCVESVTNDPAYFLLMPEFYLRKPPPALMGCEEGSEVAAMRNLELLSHPSFQPAWQKLVALTGEYACLHDVDDGPDDTDTDTPLEKREKYVVPPVDALRLMVPFMFKCFNKPWEEDQLPDGWSVEQLHESGTRKREGPNMWCYYHKQTKKIKYSRPQ